MGDILLGQDATRNQRTHAAVLQDVDLVEGEPVAHEALVLGEDRAAQVEVEVHAATVHPAVVLLAQPHGDLVVRDGDQGLDAVVAAALEHVPVELDARLVGLVLVAHREDAAPVDGGAEDLHAHLAEELDVLAIVMIEVDALVAGIVLLRVDDTRVHARGAHGTTLEMVFDARALAASCHAPSHWLAAVAPPHRNPSGKCAMVSPFR